MEVAAPPYSYQIAAQPPVAIEEQLTDATLRLSQSSRACLPHEAKRFCDTLEEALTEVSEPGYAVELVRSQLLDALERDDEAPGSSRSLRHMQLALACPAALSLRERRSLFVGIDRQSKWPNVHKAVASLIAQQSPAVPLHLDAALLDGTRQNALGSADTPVDVVDVFAAYDDFETHLMLCGPKSASTHTLALVFLHRLSTQKDASVEAMWLERAFTSLRAHNQSLCKEHLALARFGFHLWRNLQQSLPLDNARFSELRCAAVWLQDQPALAQVDKARLHYEWRAFRDLQLSHTLPDLSEDMRLEIAVVELLDMLAEPSHKLGVSLTQLRNLAPLVRVRLSELHHGDAQARQWARSYLGAAYQLLTGSTPSDGAVSVESPRLPPPYSPAGQGTAGVANNDLKQRWRCSEDDLASRSAAFDVLAADILGQDTVKEMLKSHFYNLLRGYKSAPLYLFGPSRIGKTELLKRAHRAFFPDAHISEINCRAITADVLQGSEQKWVGGAPGHVALGLMGAGCSTAPGGVTRRRDGVILFDDVDHCDLVAQRLVATAVAREPFIDNFFRTEIDLSNVLMAMCGNSEQLTAHFRGRISMIEMFTPSTSAQVAIVQQEVAREGGPITLSPMLAKRLADDEISPAGRLEEGISGLLVQTNRLLERSRYLFGNAQKPWRLGTADAVDFVAHELNAPAHMAGLWQKWLYGHPFVTATNPPGPVPRYARNRPRVVFEGLLGPWLHKAKTTFIATHGTSGMQLFDERALPSVIQVMHLEQDGRGGFYHEKRPSISLKDDLAARRNLLPHPLISSDWVERFAEASHILFFWAQPRYAEMLGLQASHEHLCVTPLQFSQKPAWEMHPHVLPLGTFLDKIEEGLKHLRAAEIAA